MSRQDIISSALRVLEKQGFAIFFGVAVLLMVWRGGAWIGTDVIAPVRDGHLEFLHSLAASSEKSAEGVAGLAEGVKDMGQSLERLEKKLDRAIPMPREE